MGKVVSRRMPFSLLVFTHVARQLQETPQALFLCGCLYIIVWEGPNMHMAVILALPSLESVALSAVPRATAKYLCVVQPAATRSTCESGDGRARMPRATCHNIHNARKSSLIAQSPVWLALFNLIFKKPQGSPHT